MSQQMMLLVTVVTANRTPCCNEALIGARVLASGVDLGDFRTMSFALRVVAFFVLSAASTAVLALPYLSIQ
jgi:hypothetical protein